jgi:signal transduction histidine kinase
VEAKPSHHRGPRSDRASLNRAASGARRPTALCVLRDPSRTYTVAVTLSMLAPQQRKPSVFARLAGAIPPEPASAPITYSGQLVAYVGVMCALALAVALITVRAPSDAPALVLGAVAIFALVLVMVRSFGGVSAPWSPTAFVHLALSLAFGPAGALAAAVAATVATAIRLRSGWFRALLNLADLFLVNIAAYETFHALTHQAASHLWIVALAGTSAGAVSYLVNSVVLAGAVSLSSTVSIWTFLRSTIGVIPYELGYGLGAAGFAHFSQDGGAPYLAMWLAPVVSIQGFLVMLAVRTNAHTADRERHARERVELLQRIITAADDERFKTASDLHDGPVAHISGLALMLSAAARDASDKSAAMEEVADELRKVQGELRTQIFALSPHDLDKPGRLREEVIAQQLGALRERGVDVDVAIPDVVPLDRPALELVHRVCREALANAARHSRATHVAVGLVVEGAKVILTIDDDGQGFSVEDLERRRAEGHFGTRFLAEKAEVAHGNFEVRSEPGNGSHVRLSLPVADAMTTTTTP